MFNFDFILTEYLHRCCLPMQHGLWQTANRTSCSSLSTCASFLPLPLRPELCTQLPELWISGSTPKLNLLAAFLIDALHAWLVSSDGHPCFSFSIYHFQMIG
ncbi:hypothetical protein AMECASPLE_000682 [Ameca splendens]|uniref:Uncharacterized protein n=1 Tax=Ameca splendens TaxID=208324 RepID=A0ABV0XXV9_9TELE